ncbi:hypothetical protein HDU98_009903 [Podochytrium sp. JEL0797]|nr:hypothetical protein HDU98_009903 [Podochytrium sp. JEL0797]
MPTPMEDESSLFFSKICISDNSETRFFFKKYSSDNLDLSYRFDLDEIERSRYREDNDAAEKYADDSSRFMREFGDASIEVEHEDSDSAFVSLSNRLQYDHEAVEDEDSYFNYSLDNTRDCLASAKREERRSQFTNSMVIRTAPPVTLKKSDPVAKFHAHQQRWKKDEFLARRDAKPKPTLTGQHSSVNSGASVIPVKQRHDLAAMRPTYDIKSPDIVPIKWVATSPPTKHALGDPDKWIDSADTAAETNVVDHPIEDSLDPVGLAKELLTLREDLKILALSRQKNFRKAEANPRLVAFVDAVAPEDSSDKTRQTVPRYMQVLEHAEMIVRASAASKDASKTPLEFMSLLEAQLVIRELSKELVVKEQELKAKQQELEEKDLVISELRESAESFTNKLNETSSVSETQAVARNPPTPTVATTMDSVSGLLGKIRCTSGSFFNPLLGSRPPAATSAETGIQPLVGQMVPDASSTSKKTPAPATPASKESTTPDPKFGSPDDPSASVTACSDWFQCAETYDFFISYRVATDAHTAMELYFRLINQRISDEYGQTRQVKVYWDKECLKKGQEWHVGFVEGLKNSRCVLMLMSPGTLEGFQSSNARMDNVLLEWETAILAARKYLCVAQPVFISDSAKHINALDINNYIRSDECPKLQPGGTKTQQLSAFTTLSAAMNLQGVPLDVSEVSWTIPDLIKALQTFSPLQSKEAAELCEIEASFKKYFPTEVFGYPWEHKKGFLDARKLTDLKLSFKKFPSMSKLSMEVLAHGLSQDFSFLSELNLKCVNIEKKSTWNLLASALTVNKSLVH